MFDRGQDVSDIGQNGYTKLVDQVAYNKLTQDEKDALREQRKKDGKNMFYIHQEMNEIILRNLTRHGTHWKFPIKVWTR